jgi:hypothetical protein
LEPWYSNVLAPLAPRMHNCRPMRQRLLSAGLASEREANE